MRDINRYKDPVKRKEYIKKYQAKWRIGEKGKEFQRNYHRRIRQETIKHYGGKCFCCGEETYEFLTFDHVNGGGGKHRKVLKGNPLQMWLRKNNYPKGFQILCYNCNNAKSVYGKCPHSLQRVIKINYEKTRERFIV